MVPWNYDNLLEVVLSPIPERMFIQRIIIEITYVAGKDKNITNGLYRMFSENCSVRSKFKM